MSPPIKGADLHATLPGFWVIGAVLAWAIHWQRLGGIVAATAVAVADPSIRSEISTQQYGNVFIVLIGGLIVGQTSALLKEMAAARDRAQRELAGSRERAQLARVVHDGVLQVLALMQRRGRELGGDLAELGRLAAEQEARLRSLVQQGAKVSPVGAEDLAERLTSLQTPRVTVSVPGSPSPCPPRSPTRSSPRSRSAWTMCVATSAPMLGPGSPLEDRCDRVVVSVRDNGSGIAAGRLEEASADDRLGVPESIRGRIADLGAPPTCSRRLAREPSGRSPSPRTGPSRPEAAAAKTLSIRADTVSESGS